MKLLRTSSTLLEPQLLEDLLKLGMFAHVGQLNVHTCTQAGAQVGGTGEDVAQVLIPHECMAPIFEQAFNLQRAKITTLYESSVFFPSAAHENTCLPW